MEYRYEATSVAGFVQQLAVAYVTHGYWFYVKGEIPPDKDAARVDDKLLDKYGIAISKWARYRRKKQGLANVHYLRFDRTFVLIATRGENRFFEEESGNICDIRRRPVQFRGYSIGYRRGVDQKWHPSVRIAADEYRQLRDELIQKARRGQLEYVETRLRNLLYEPYAPIRRQLFCIARQCSRVCHVERPESEWLPSLVLRRRVCRPFE